MATESVQPMAYMGFQQLGKRKHLPARTKKRIKHKSFLFTIKKQLLAALYFVSLNLILTLRL